MNKIPCYVRRTLNYTKYLRNLNWLDYIANNIEIIPNLVGKKK